MDVVVQHLSSIEKHKNRLDTISEYESKSVSSDSERVSSRFNKNISQIALAFQSVTDRLPPNIRQHRGGLSYD